MALHIFKVITGQTIETDIDVNEKLKHTKQLLAKRYGIPIDKQVLYCSGGQLLTVHNDDHQLCGFIYGMENQLLYIVDKRLIDNSDPPRAYSDYTTFFPDIEDRANQSLQLVSSRETIIIRAKIAADIYSSACNEYGSIKRLLDDQMMQHQAWQAIVASMDDYKKEFEKKYNAYCSEYQWYLGIRDSYSDMIEQLPETLRYLERVPLLECLASCSSFSTMSLLDTAASRSGSSPESVDSSRMLLSLRQQPKNLYEWVIGETRGRELDEGTNRCLTVLNSKTPEVFQDSQARAVSLLHLLCKDISRDKYEIGGISERLTRLNALSEGAKEHLRRIQESAQSVNSNMQSVQKTRDESVVPELCTSHKRQIMEMIRHFQGIQSTQRKCENAKQELTNNLHTRYRWLQETQMNTSQFYNEMEFTMLGIQRLRNHRQNLIMFRTAPELYAKSVVEVVRRRTRTENFLKWATAFCEERCEAYEKEIERREKFYDSIRKNFVKTLFPGIDDVPPAFAIECPKKFDDKLPPIQAEDILFLRDTVPELADELKYPEPVDLTSAETITELEEAPSELPAPDCFADRSAEHSFDPASSDIVILETDMQSGDEVTSNPSEQFYSMQQGTEVQPPVNPQAAFQGVPSSSPVQFPPMFRGSDKCSLSMDTGTMLHAEMKRATASSSKGTTDKRAYVGELNLSEEMESPAKIEKKDTSAKSPTGISPKSPPLDEFPSEGFTTADFYIDESMPSSMTESNTRKLIELQQIIQEKSFVIEERDHELEEHKRIVGELKPKLQKANENFKLLHDLVEKGTLQLKCELLSVEKQCVKDKDEVQQYMALMAKSLLDTISRFESEQLAVWEKTVEDLKAEFNISRTEWEEKLDLEMEKFRDSQEELALYSKKLHEKEEEIERLKHDFTEQLNNQASKAEQTFTEMKTKLEIEYELELEKIQNELQLKIETKSCDISALQEVVQKKDEEIRKVTSEYEEKYKSIEEDVRRKFQEEHEIEIKVLTENHAHHLKEEMDNLTELLKKEHEEHLKGIQTGLIAEYSLENESNKKLLLEKDEQIVTLESDAKKLEEELCDCKQSMLKAQAQIVEIKLSHEREIETLMEDHSIKMNEMIPKEEHEGLMSLIREDLEAAKQTAIAELQAKEEEKYQEKVDSIIKQTHRENQDRLTSLQSSITAEKQVLFNEALNKAVSDKDKVIEELKKNEEKYSNENAELKRIIEGYEKEKAASASASEGSRESMSVQTRLEEALGAAQKQIMRLEAELKEKSRMGASMMESVVPVGGDFPMEQSRMHEYEDKLKNKDEELAALQSQLETMSASTREAMDHGKISITSCKPGEIVLLCLDEKHGHYVVFSVGPTLHFLHADSYSDLGLKTGPGEMKKSWILGEIVSKELCKARKSTNRFKVPMGTTFYRVKARPWQREASESMMQGSIASSR